MSRTMKATTRRTAADSFTHEIEIRGHELTIDEPVEIGGNDEGPSPQELLAGALAACTAVTIEMYAKRKDWDVSSLEVQCEYTPAEAGAPTKFGLVLRLPDTLSQEQVEKLAVIATKCPVHRTLAGEVMFEEQIELTSAAAG